MQTVKPTMLCLGEMSTVLVELLKDVFSELNVEACESQALGARPWVVVVAQGVGEVQPLVERARVEGRGAPVIALIPIQDARWARAAFRAGADGCYALGTPLSRLRGVVSQCALRSATDALRSLGASCSSGGCR